MTSKPAIGRAHRCAHEHIIILEVFDRKQPSVIVHPIGDGSRKGAAVEPLNSVRRDIPVSNSQVGLLEDVAFGEGLAIGLEEDGARALKAGPGRFRYLSGESRMRR